MSFLEMFYAFFGGSLFLLKGIAAFLLFCAVVAVAYFVVAFPLLMVVDLIQKRKGVKT